MRAVSIFVCIVVFLGFFGSTVMSSVDQSTCPHPAVTSVAIAPNTVVGGVGGTLSNFTATVTFAGAIPQGCQHFLLPGTTPPANFVNPNFCTGFIGDGTNQYKCPAGTQVVDSNQTAALTFQSRVSQTGTLVGGVVTSAQVTATPVKLRSFSVNLASIGNTQQATGTILLEGIVNNTTRALVNIKANPSTAVQIPSSLTIICCQFDGAGHSKATFTITGKAVTTSTNVVISVNRPNQTALSQTITVKH